MNLYQSDHSPYASRCQIQIYAKGIDDIEMCDPPGGISTDEFKEINPSGKIPALEVDGLVLREAQIIREFLEDKVPSPHMNPAERDQAVVDEKTALLATHFAMLESDLTSAGYDGGDYAVGGKLSLADCALVPALFVGVSVLPAFGMAEPLAATPKLARYWEAIQKDEYCGRVLAEMTTALKARMGGA